MDLFKHNIEENPRSVGKILYKNISVNEKISLKEERKTIHFYWGFFENGSYGIHLKKEDRKNKTWYNTLCVAWYLENNLKFNCDKL